MQKLSDSEWDQVWIGADIATMVAGKGPYGNIKEAALAVKGERIAWIGRVGGCEAGGIVIAQRLA